MSEEGTRPVLTLKLGDSCTQARPSLERSDSICRARPGVRKAKRPSRNAAMCA